MPAEIVTVGFCPQYYVEFEVTSGKGSVYTVRINNTRNEPSCTCPAFKFSGEARICKHIKLIWDHGCLWNPQWHDAGPNDLARNGIVIIDAGPHAGTRGQPCPGCGEPLVPVQIAV